MPKKWNEAPKYTYEERVQQAKREAKMKRGQSEYQRLISEEKLLGIVSYRDRKRTASADAAERQGSASQFNPLKGTSGAAPKI